MPITPLQLVGVAPEASFGTFVAPTKYIPGICQINSTDKVTRPVQSRGTRAQVLDAPTGFETGATITAELIPEALSLLIANWFGSGADVLTGSSGIGFTHTLTPQNTLKSLSLELDSDVTAQVLARQVVGNYVDQLVLRGTAQQLATVQATLIGQREITPATPGLPSNATPAISTIQPFDHSFLAASYKGVATTQLIDYTLTLSNGVQRVFASNSKLYVARLQPTLRNVQLQTTLDFLDTVFYNDWASDALITTGSPAGWQLKYLTPFNIPGASNPFQVLFNLPAIRLQDQFNLQDASQVLQQQLTWSATVGSGTNEVNAVLVNSENSQLA